MESWESKDPLGGAARAYMSVNGAVCDEQLFREECGHVLRLGAIQRRHVPCLNAASTASANAAIEGYSASTLTATPGFGVAPHPG